METFAIRFETNLQFEIRSYDAVCVLFLLCFAASSILFSISFVLFISIITFNFQYSVHSHTSHSHDIILYESFLFVQSIECNRRESVWSFSIFAFEEREKRNTKLTFESRMCATLSSDWHIVIGLVDTSYSLDRSIIFLIRIQSQCASSEVRIQLKIHFIVFSVDVRSNARAVVSIRRSDRFTLCVKHVNYLSDTHTHHLHRWQRRQWFI